MSRPALELILFDAAGTLIEPAEPVENVYQREFAQQGWICEAADLKAAFRRIFREMGDPAFSISTDGDAAERAWWKQLVRETILSMGIEAPVPDFEKCFDRLFNHYEQGAAWSVFPEVGDVLVKLRARGHPLAVVSNFDRRLHRVLSEAGLSAYFDLILTSADVSARKPSPLLLQTAMSQLFKPAGTTRLVGDSLHADGGAAAAAGIRAFILERPRTTLVDFVKWLDEDFC